MGYSKLDCYHTQRSLRQRFLHRVHSSLARFPFLGRSEWQASLSSKTASDNIAMLPAIPDCYAIKGGLILNFKNEIQSHNHVTLQITYQPNLGLDEQAISYSTFTLEK